MSTIHIIYLLLLWVVVTSLPLLLLIKLTRKRYVKKLDVTLRDEILKIICSKDVPINTAITITKDILNYLIRRNYLLHHEENAD